MVDFSKIDNIFLAPGQEELVDFGGEASSFEVQNHGLAFLKVFTKKTPTQFNVEPATIFPEELRVFPLRTDQIKILSDRPCFVDILAGFRAEDPLAGKDYFTVEFTPANAPSMMLKQVQPGGNIRNVIIKVVDAFESSMDLSLGFPLDPEELVAHGQVALSRPGEYAFSPYRINSAVESLTLYLTGASANGKGVLFVEE